MPAPSSADELLELIQKSGVADEARLASYVAGLKQEAGVPADPKALAGQLVRDGLLTYFQAEQLLQGKWKRFSIGKYKVLEKLGSGGMGQVFLCEHKLMRRRVAVKVLPTAKAEDEASRDRFYREARAIAAVDHANIVRAYDIDQDDNLHFLVMEYVDGTNLQDLVKKSGPLDVTRACHYVYASAVGLQHAHEIGLVHRDVKPGNILVDRAGVVKILDMGLARFFHDEEDNLTKRFEENILGTADYLAPEQAEDSHGVDIRADIYSLGATFYFLLAGQQPFPEGSVAQKLLWQKSRDPRPIQAIRPEVPDDVAAVVARMMRKDPAARYQTPAGVMAALADRVATPIPPPADRELPTLSPAAAGTPSGSARGPATVAARTTAAPTLAGGVPTLPGGTVVTPMSLQPAEVWGDLAPDTAPVAQGATTLSEPTVQPRSGRALAGRPDRGHRSLFVPLLVAGSVLLAVAAAAVVYFAVLKDRKGGSNDGGGTPPVVTGPRRLTVSRAGGEATYGTLREALVRARPGDTVVIAEERVVEPALQFKTGSLRDVTVESGVPGRPAVIEFQPSAGDVPLPMLDLSQIDGFRLRNVDFDGKGVAEVGVQLSGFCHGATFENVTVRGVTAAGVRLVNVAGEAGRPLTFDRLTVVGAAGEAGVSMTATGRLETRYVTLKDCQFQGPGKAGVRVDGPAKEVVISGTGFAKLAAGLRLVRTAPGKLPPGIQLSGNRFELVEREQEFDPKPKKP